MVRLRRVVPSDEDAVVESSGEVRGDGRRDAGAERADDDDAPPELAKTEADSKADVGVCIQLAAY